MDFDKVISERHSARGFKGTKKPDYRAVIKAIDAANKAPLAGNIATFKYLVISDKVKISRLAQAAQQNFISSAAYVVVLCSDKSILEKSFYNKTQTYLKQQAGAAIENFLLSITNQKLSSCWIGLFDENTVKNALSIPDSIEVEALLPVGYELHKDKQKRKPNLNNNLFFHRYDNKHMNPQFITET